MPLPGWLLSIPETHRSITPRLHLCVTCVFFVECFHPAAPYCWLLQSIIRLSTQIYLPREVLSSLTGIPYCISLVHFLHSTSPHQMLLSLFICFLCLPPSQSRNISSTRTMTWVSYSLLCPQHLEHYLSCTWSNNMSQSTTLGIPHMLKLRVIWY